MSAIELSRLFPTHGIHPVVQLPSRLLLLRLYLPSILLTVLGVLVLSISWISLVNNSLPPAWFAAMGLVQVAWLASILEVWLQNTYSILRRELPSNSGTVLQDGSSSQNLAR